ncbi:hypothetical protein H1C71_017039, partial [Ictidomys tridecemlineatus]
QGSREGCGWTEAAGGPDGQSNRERLRSVGSTWGSGLSRVAFSRHPAGCEVFSPAGFEAWEAVVCLLPLFGRALPAPPPPGCWEDQLRLTGSWASRHPMQAH